MKKHSLLIGLFFVQVSAAAVGTALDEYISFPDSQYSYVQIGGPSFHFASQTSAYTLKLTSQAWRTISEVDHPVWIHWATIIVPELDTLLGPTKDTALILIDGGDYTDPVPAVESQFRYLAAGTRTVIVVLKGVPNQPLQFADESYTRSEDEIIAYSWDKYLRGGDSFWPVQLPMVKSVVRCMDAVQEFVSSAAGKTIHYFVLTGGSKRGWTAWLTAAVDSRVTALAPIVSDLLNMRRSFAHHWGAYGFWAEALQPYEDFEIFGWFDTPEMDALLAIVDPYEYRERLTIPKYIINSAGDDFFVMDSIQFYIDGLPGETYLRHVPNTDHYLTHAESDVFASMAPYYDAFLANQSRPRFHWSLELDGSIRVVTQDVPKAVILWQASNPQSRDFRLTTIGPSWSSRSLVDQGGGIFVGQVPPPQEGWTAFFVEVVFVGRTLGTSVYDYHFSTEMRVIPETCPFEADFTRDRNTNLSDLMILGGVWLQDSPYYDLAPRRTGDGIINLSDFSVLSQHWLEGDF